MRKSSAAEQKERKMIKVMARAVSKDRKELKDAVRVITDALPVIDRLINQK